MGHRVIISLVQHFDPVPRTPELALKPPNFAPGTTLGLIDAPNARLISTVIAGGVGANGQSGESADPIASTWLYVFGQFLDHDLSLEENLQTAEAINIIVPTNDPVFAAGTSITMSRDTRSPTTGTIINTVAGYLDLSQLCGSTTAIADSLRNADGTLVTSDDGQAPPSWEDQLDLIAIGIQRQRDVGT